MASLFSHIRCMECRHRTPPSLEVDVCPACGSPWLEAEYQLERMPRVWDEVLRWRPYTMWRYRELLPFPDTSPPVSMGEGGTPLLRATGLERVLGHPGIWIKDERQQTTGSFKDRQAAMAVSALMLRGIKEVVLASTGNAAVAYAAYCARANIKLWVFVTSSVLAEKTRELALYNAEVIKVTGTYDQAKAVAARFAEHRGLFLDRGARAIVGKESMKTVAFEIAEQWPRTATNRWGAPDWYVQSVSGGIGPLGVLKGFEELAAAGIIDRVPKLAIVQTEGCNPMVRAWEQGRDEAVPIEHPDSLITVLSTGNPGMAYRHLKQALDRYGGAMVSVSDGEAFRAMRKVARTEGISMEPAASVAFAGLERLLKKGLIGADETVVVNCSGHTFGAEKYALEDRHIFNLSLQTRDVERPTEGLATALAELDERITTVVIIDDNPYDSRLIRKLLEAHRPYRIFEAHTAQEGLDLVHQHQPDVVLLDLMMPDVDGFAILDTLKADPQTARIPTVIISAKTLTDEERTRLEIYAESVWQKGSFSARELASHVAKLLEREGESLQAPAVDLSAGTQRDERPPFGKWVRQRVLVVDSNKPEAYLIKRLLETEPGLEVAVAHSGVEALALAGQADLDLLIMDLEFPDIDGQRLLILLKTSQANENVPVIVVTDLGALEASTRAHLTPNVETIWPKSELDRSSFLTYVQTILRR